MKAVAIFAEMRDPIWMSTAYGWAGDVELRAGNLVEARRFHWECILGWQKFGTRISIAQELERFALIAQAQNQPTRAARLLGAGEALREGIGVPVFGDERHDIDSAVAGCTRKLMIRLSSHIGPMVAP